MKKDDYSKLTILELTALLKKAKTQKEKDFFFDLIDVARHEAVKRVIK